MVVHEGGGGSQVDMALFRVSENIVCTHSDTSTVEANREKSVNMIKNMSLMRTNLLIQY